MKRMLLCCLALWGVLGVTACHTVRGVGQDIEQGGKAIQKAAH